MPGSVRSGPTARSAPGLARISPSASLLPSLVEAGIGDEAGSRGRFRIIDGEELGLGERQVVGRRDRESGLLGDLLLRPIADFLAHTVTVEGERLRPG